MVFWPCKACWRRDGPRELANWHSRAREPQKALSTTPKPPHCCWRHSCRPDAAPLAQQSSWLTRSLCTHTARWLERAAPCPGLGSLLNKLTPCCTQITASDHQIKCVVLTSILINLISQITPADKAAYLSASVKAERIAGGDSSLFYFILFFWNMLYYKLASQ